MTVHPHDPDETRRHFERVEEARRPLADKYPNFIPIMQVIGTVICITGIIAIAMWTIKTHGG